MSMTLEEAIELLCYGDWLNVISEHIGKQDTERIAKAMCIVGKALRPVSREQVVKVWRGEWNQDEHGRVVCNRCGSMAAIGTENALHNAKKYDRFCFYCGAPMTDDAVDMMLRRWKEVVGSEAKAD